MRVARPGGICLEVNEMSLFYVILKWRACTRALEAKYKNAAAGNVSSATGARPEIMYNANSQLLPPYVA